MLNYIKRDQTLTIRDFFIEFCYHKNIIFNCKAYKMLFFFLLFVKIQTQFYYFLAIYILLYLQCLHSTIL